MEATEAERAVRFLYGEMERLGLLDGERAPSSLESPALELSSRDGWYVVSSATQPERTSRFVSHHDAGDFFAMRLARDDPRFSFPRIRWELAPTGRDEMLRFLADEFHRLCPRDPLNSSVSDYDVGRHSGDDQLEFTERDGCWRTIYWERGLPEERAIFSDVHDAADFFVTDHHISREIMGDPSGDYRFPRPKWKDFRTFE